MASLKYTYRVFNLFSNETVESFNNEREMLEYLAKLLRSRGGEQKLTRIGAEKIVRALGKPLKNRVKMHMLKSKLAVLEEEENNADRRTFLR